MLESRLMQLEDSQLEHTFQTNILSFFRVTRAALRHLKSGAAIINTGSITGLEGSEQLLDYSSTKGAIHSFTKSLAQNLVGRRIRVNCVAPGPVWTPLNPSDKPREKMAKVRRRYADGASGAAGRGRAGVRVLRIQRGLELHHG